MAGSFEYALFMAISWDSAPQLKMWSFLAQGSFWAATMRFIRMLVEIQATWSS